MNQCTDDYSLLQSYVCEKSDAAFRQLVERHIDYVYSIALRQSRNPALAEEVSQAAFILLARKAGELGKGVILSAWLFRTVRFIAQDALKAEKRRQKREQQFFEMNLPDDQATEATAEQVMPLLDGALAGLSESDRSVLLLRYFERQSHKDLATRLDISEAAVRQRVARAVEKLRRLLLRRGVAIPGSVLAGYLSTQCVQAAPAGLAATIAGAGVAGLGASASTMGLVGAGGRVLIFSKLKSAALAGVTVAALIAAGIAIAFAQPLIERSNGISRTEALYFARGLGSTTTGLIQGGQDIAKIAVNHLQERHLRIGEFDMEWSIHPGNIGEGFLYFCQPLSNTPVWEFAPSNAQSFDQVLIDALPQRFYGLGDPDAATAFGQPSIDNALPVKPGQILFARHVKQPSTIYAIRVGHGGVRDISNLRCHLVRAEYKCLKK